MAKSQDYGSTILLGLKREVGNVTEEERGIVVERSGWSQESHLPTLRLSGIAPAWQSEEEENTPGLEPWQGVYIEITCQRWRCRHSRQRELGLRYRQHERALLHSRRLQ